MTDTVNNFGSLTPEQQAELERQRIEQVNVLDLLPLLMGGGFGAAGYGIARSQLGRVPSALIGVGLGSGAADITQRSVDRYQNSLRDAEGQPGGFYGENPRARIMRELMK